MTKEEFLQILTGDEFATAITRTYTRPEFKQAVSSVVLDMFKTNEFKTAVQTAVAPQFQEITERFGQVDKRFEQMDTRLDRIDIRLDNMDNRLNGIDNRLDGMDARFDGIDVRLGGIDTRFDTIDDRFDGTDSRLDNMDSRFDRNERFMLEQFDKQNTAFKTLNDRMEFFVDQILTREDQTIHELKEIRQEITFLGNRVTRLEAAAPQITAAPR